MKTVDENKVSVKLSEAILLRDKILSDFEKLDEIKDCLCVLSCPHEVGDIVKIEGYSFRGKNGIIERITPYKKGINRASTELDSKWTVHGVVLKKDGTKSKNIFSFNENRKW